jgi:protein-S-isoprenylcysteine O-methyltransferase Ste14
MKWSRIRKLTWKLLVVYALVVVLVAFAEPDLVQAYFWIGVGLIVLGELVRIWAAGHLVKNKELTTTGPYAHVKNPLYVGTFLIMVGFCVIAKGGGRDHWLYDNVNWILLGVGLLGFILYYVPYKKKREGDRLREHFGEAWDHYDKNVPDYFPRLRPYVRPDGGRVRWSFRAVCENSEQWTPLAIAAGVVAIAFSPQIMSLFV